MVLKKLHQRKRANHQGRWERLEHQDHNDKAQAEAKGRNGKRNAEGQ